MSKQRHTLDIDLRRRPTSIGPMRDSKAGTKPLEVGSPPAPPMAPASRSRKARIPKAR